MKAGSPSRSGELESVDLVLPEEMVPEMRVPLGRLLEGQNPRVELPGSARLIAVGDMCTLNLLGQGKAPWVALVDYKTERRSMGAGGRFGGFRRELRLRNPAGTISREAWKVLREAMSSEESARVDVDGEEDLLALPSIALAPSGSVVAYGMPSKGLVLVDVDERAKMKVIELMRRMVVGNGG